jgi:hypothetical protein
MDGGRDDKGFIQSNRWDRKKTVDNTTTDSKNIMQYTGSRKSEHEVHLVLERVHRILLRLCILDRQAARLDANRHGHLHQLLWERHATV